MSDHLSRAKDEAGRNHLPSGYSTASSPDERTIPSILVGILDALIAIAERLPTEAAPPMSADADERTDDAAVEVEG